MRRQDSAVGMIVHSTNKRRKLILHLPPCAGRRKDWRTAQSGNEIQSAAVVIVGVSYDDRVEWRQIVQPGPHTRFWSFSKVQQ